SPRALSEAGFTGFAELPELRARKKEPNTPGVPYSVLIFFHHIFPILPQPRSDGGECLGVVAGEEFAGVIDGDWEIVDRRGDELHDAVAAKGIAIGVGIG